MKALRRSQGGLYARWATSTGHICLAVTITAAIGVAGFASARPR